MLQANKEMVSAEGIESALKRQIKYLTEHSWQSKALLELNANLGLKGER